MQKKLLTIYAPPGSVIPKNKMKLEVSKIRGELLMECCVQSLNLNLSNESDGIIELSQKYNKHIGKNILIKIRKCNRIINYT